MKFCDEHDCLLHPIYIEKETKRQNEEIEERLKEVVRRQEKAAAQLQALTPRGFGSYNNLVYSGLDSGLSVNTDNGITFGNIIPSFTSPTVNTNYTPYPQYGNSSFNLGGYWDCSSDPESTRIKTKYIEIPVECIVCKNRKQLDMKNHIMAQEAKRLLES